MLIFCRHNISSTLPRFYQNNTNNCRNNVHNERHYFEVYNNDNDDVYAYIYIPLNKVKRCVCQKMLYRMSGDIYYLHLLLLHKPSRGNKNNLTYIPVLGGGEPLNCASYQQSAIAHGIVDSIGNVRLTFWWHVWIWDSTMQELLCSIDLTWVWNSCNIWQWSTEELHVYGLYTVS